MRDVLLGPVETPLMALQAAVAFVLLIACGNLANLLLARTLARRRELSVRLAIGAGRGRLIRQLLSESMLLAVIGGAAGIAVAYAAVPLLRSLVPERSRGARNPQRASRWSRAGHVPAALDFLRDGFRTRSRLARIRRRHRRRAEGRRRRRTARRAAPQDADRRSNRPIGCPADRRRHVPAQFRGARVRGSWIPCPGVLTVQVGIPSSRYKEPEQVLRFTSEWMEDIRRLPGVETVGLTSHLPVSGMDSRTGLAIEDVAPSDPNQPRRAHIRWVSSRILPGDGHEDRAGPPLPRNRSRRQPAGHDRQRGGGPQVFSARESARSPRDTVAE